MEKKKSVKRRSTLLLIAGGCVALLLSCTTVRWVSVERLTPAGASIPEKVERVAVVNNMPVHRMQPVKYTDELMLFDSRRVADSLAQYLADAGFYREVVVYDSVLSTAGAISYDERELSPTRVASLSRRLGADMLVSVEFAAFIPDWFYLPSLEGDVHIIAKLYLPGEVRPLEIIHRKRAVGWYEVPADPAVMEESLASVAATLCLSRIVPRWKSVEFPFYTGANVEMRDAAVFVDEGNWDAARNLWERQLTHKNRRRRMEAHHNMAVWHEIHDDTIGTADRYAREALRLSHKPGKDGKERPTADTDFIRNYIHKMERRGKDLERLGQQMSRFSEEIQP